MKIKRLDEFSLYDNMSNDFINLFGLITESDETEYEKVANRVISDLRLNVDLSLTFGAGINAFYPMVSKLMTNMKIDITPDSVVLLIICAFTIIYLEERKFKDSDEERVLIKDKDSMLEELKMKGIGNGIVKNVIKLFKSIEGIFKIIGRHLNKVAKNFIDMFSYTAILIPIMHIILFFIGKYDLNINTFLDNFSALTLGVLTLVAKNAIISIIGNLRVKKDVKSKIIDEIDDTFIIKKVSDFTLNKKDGEMINEQ